MSDSFTEAQFKARGLPQSLMMLLLVSPVSQGSVLLPISYERLSVKSAWSQDGSITLGVLCIPFPLKSGQGGSPTTLIASLISSPQWILTTTIIL